MQAIFIHIPFCLLANKFEIVVVNLIDLAKVLCAKISKFKSQQPKVVECEKDLSYIIRI
jgi:hypothetical protein